MSEIQKIKDFITKYEKKFVDKDEIKDLTECVLNCNKLEESEKESTKTIDSLRHDLIESMKHQGVKEEENNSVEEKPMSLEDIANEIIK